MKRQGSTYGRILWATGKVVLISFLVFRTMTAFSQCPDNVDKDYDYFLKDISIEGSTNVNNFSFRYDNPLYAGAINLNENHTKEDRTGILDFNIPVHSFKGSIPAMRKDFLDLLKAAEYPEIIVGIEMDEFNCIAAGIKRDRIELIVTLAGTQKAIDAETSAGFESGNRLVLHGISRFFLTDFHLEPPEKVMGLVRVQNEVFIKFDIVISDMQWVANQASK